MSSLKPCAAHLGKSATKVLHVNRTSLDWVSPASIIKQKRGLLRFAAVACELIMAIVKCQPSVLQ